MIIRNATYHDAPVIKLLLETLGYTVRLSILLNQLDTLFGKGDHQAFVYELRKEVVGFISIHYLPQLAFDGELVLITYLAVDDSVKDQGIAKALEQYITDIAKRRRCDQIQVHIMDWRVKEDQFYKQQGYLEYPKYYTKTLVYGE
jgi:N-acetylglutamate synthase-like GNAT family acetyltransferase